jgi:hypothetical protein
LVGAREQVPAALALVSLQRQRNFTLFASAYDQARRAIIYLRWDEQDVDTIAPSLYAGRNRKKDAAHPPAPVPVTGTVAPADTAAASTAPASKATTSPTPVTVTQAINTPPGLPGSSPFAVS